MSRRDVKKNMIAWLCVWVFLISLTGCGKQDTKADHMLRVGVVTYTPDDPFINAMTDIIKSNLKAKESNTMKVIVSVRSGDNDQQEQDEIEREPRSENARAHVRGFGRRDGGGRIVLPLPEAHPHGHEPQPHGGEQRRAAPGGDAARNGQARRAHAPEHEQRRERGKAQRIERDDGAAGSRLHGCTS